MGRWLKWISTENSQGWACSQCAWIYTTPDLLSDPDARFYDLGPGYHAARIDPERRKHRHIRELEALGYTVTLKPAA